MQRWIIQSKTALMVKKLRRIYVSDGDGLGSSFREASEDIAEAMASINLTILNGAVRRRSSAQLSSKLRELLVAILGLVGAE